MRDNIEEKRDKSPRIGKSQKKVFWLNGF